MPDKDDRRAKVIEQVRQLFAQADHPNTTETERATFASKALNMMAKYQIDEFVLNERAGTEDSIVIAQIRIDYLPPRLLVPDERMMLVHAIAHNFDCHGVIRKMEDSADEDSGRVIKGGTFYECVGFKGDVDMTRALFMSLSVDMLEALLMEPQKDENYRRNYAAGYAGKIEDRLFDLHRRTTVMADQMGGSVALAVRSKKDKVRDFVEATYPKLGKAKTRSLSYDSAARNRGSKRAASADLGDKNRVSGSPRADAIGEGQKQLGKGDS